MPVIKPSERKVISSFKGEKKKKVRQLIVQIMANRKAQKEIFKKSLVDPFIELDKIGKLTLNNQVTINEFMHREKKLSEFIDSFFKTASFNTGKEHR